MAATHNGTCQVCGRLQALVSGRLAAHGYEVLHHYFAGVCPGAKHLPLQQNRTMADQVAADLLVHAAALEKRLLAVVAGKELPAQARSGGRFFNHEKRGWCDVMVPFAEAPEHYQREAVNAMRAQLDATARLNRDISRQITDRANAVHGTELFERTPKAERKQVRAGSVVRIHGTEYTVLDVAPRTAFGHGPGLNGKVMPHAAYERNGKTFHFPVRLIRQVNIVKE